MSKTFSSSMDVLLIDKQLACEIGLKEAIVFHEIAKLIRDSRIVHDNKQWVVITTEELQERLPFFSVSTVGRSVNRLIEIDFLEVGTWGREDAFDKRRWFTIGGASR